MTADTATDKAKDKANANVKNKDGDIGSKYIRRRQIKRFRNRMGPKLFATRFDVSNQDAES